MKYGLAVNKGGVRNYGAGPVPGEGIGDVELSSTGNVILRIGREIAPGAGAWEQVAHVVLTADEWARLVVQVDSLRNAAGLERAVTS